MPFKAEMFLMLACAMFSMSQAKSNLPNHTELVVAVVADENWVRKEEMTMAQLETFMTESISSSSSSHVSMEIVFNTMTAMNISEDADLGKKKCSNIDAI